MVECTPLMCLQAAKLLPVELHWAFLRSAGSIGARIFDEMASLQLLPIYGEMRRNVDDDDINDMGLVLRSIPLSQQGVDSVEDGEVEGLTVVYSPLATIGKDVCVFSVRVLRLQWCPSNFEIPTHQLSNHNLLTDVHLANFEHITCIGNCFMESCSNLKTVDLSALCNVRTIGMSFLSDCRELAHINLPPLKNLVSISHYFMSGCESLQKLDVSPLASVEEIGSLFLHGCTALSFMDLSPLTAVKYLGGGMLDECINITSIHLPRSAWAVNRDVGASFLAHTERLVSIDLSALSGTTVVRDLFLAHCMRLQTTVDLLAPLRNVTAIGDHFMAHCSGITSLHVKPLSKVITIGRSFLEGCSGLSELDGLEHLVHVTRVGMRFLFKCTSLSKAPHADYRGLLQGAEFEADVVE